MDPRLVGRTLEPFKRDAPRARDQILEISGRIRSVLLDSQLGVESRPSRD